MLTKPTLTKKDEGGIIMEEASVRWNLPQWERLKHEQGNSLEHEQGNSLEHESKWSDELGIYYMK